MRPAQYFENYIKEYYKITQKVIERKSVGLLCSLLLIVTGCSWHPCTPAYHQQYSYLNIDLSKCACIKDSEYFLVVLVDARHLDYSDNRSLLKTLVKHPSDGSKNGDVGHAWIYLRGVDNGRIVEIEGGHSGELGLNQARYFDGMMNYLDYGYSNPTAYQRCHPRYEPDPIRYLWEEQQDGFFEQGSGGHRPTFAAKIELSPEKFKEIREMMRPGRYPYEHYSLIDTQCCSLVIKAAAIAGIELESKMTISIDQELCIKGERLRLWTDPRYSTFTFGSPDVLEASLIDAVYRGDAEYALEWYEQTHKMTTRDFLRNGINHVCRFPQRIERLIYFW